ncbi:MAG: DUF6102 family protein [Peptococcaceae bacterium]|nr:DUF6102 family protein [Peptococcaceae bacterium]
MGTLIADGIITFLQYITQGILLNLSQIMTGISGYATAVASQSWVTNTTQVIAGIASGLFALRIGWEALSRYILWNEGTGDQDGGAVWKGILRVGIFGAAATWLCLNVFQVGTWLGGAILAAPIQSTIQPAGALLGAITDSAVTQLILVGLIGGLLLVGGLVLITIQMAIRAAELVFYIVSGPIFALGQFNADGGVWNNWWRGLVVLAMSQAVQMLGIRGIVAVMAMPYPDAALPLVLALGFTIATIRGPHLLKEWSYHSGIGGGGMFFGMNLMRYGRVFGGFGTGD